MAVAGVHSFDSNNKIIKQGSGIAISDKEYIVTNYHIAEGSKAIEIKYQNKLVPYAEIIGIDKMIMHT